MLVYTSTKPVAKSEATLRGGSPDMTSPGYDAITLKNRPFHTHEVVNVCPEPIRQLPGKPQPKPIDYSRLMAKFGRK